MVAARLLRLLWNLSTWPPGQDTNERRARSLAAFIAASRIIGMGKAQQASLGTIANRSAQEEHALMNFEEQIADISDRFVNAYQNRDPTACAKAYTEDGVVMEAGSPTAIGRKEIAAGCKASMDAGLEVFNIVTTSAVADGSIGYALQAVETNHGEARVLLAMRRHNGHWLVAAEAIVS